MKRTNPPLAFMHGVPGSSPGRPIKYTEKTRISAGFLFPQA